MAVSELPDYELSESLYPAGARLKFGGRLEAYFCFLLDGSISEGAVTYTSGKVIFFPNVGAHTVTIVQPCRCLIVRVGSRMLGRANMNPSGCFDVTSLGNWEATWMAWRLYSAFLKGAPGRELRIEAIILQLLALAARSGKEKRTGHESLWLRRVRDLIDGQYLNEYRLSELASIAGVHRVHLVREFRKRYGTTIGEHVRKLRMDYAYQLLGQTKLPLREVAAACRFADQSHFTKQFKRLSGLTPAEYRNLSQGSRIESGPPVYDKQFGQDLHIGVRDGAFVRADHKAHDSREADLIAGRHLLPQAVL
jgi:AraC-like DNA-binding protein